ncbi:MAG: ABC transporter permease [Erysipelotrichia bacterium]|nr:ABC transporter permease [Erysipelotrichia bacterium]NCC54930.1 ABC transporter permease [Erysipelotrichia bacterium]
MYLFKNAVRNIQRSLGKNMLIALIIFVISLACCISLSIKQAAQTTKEEGLENLTISATIRYDRTSAMENMTPPSDDEKPDKAQMAEVFSENNLSIDELEVYAKADSVKDFYYTSSVSLNGIDDTFDPINTTNEENKNDMGNDKGGMNFTSADFTLLGYSSYEAMSDFSEGIKSVDTGTLFNIDNDHECIISDELATYNELSVGSEITLVNPNNESETFTLKVTGIYTSSESDTMGMQRSDPANQIYTSYQTILTMVEESEANSANESESSYLTATTNGTYVFANVSDYETFESEARALGLADTYTISSSDLNAYEQSLTPLNNLANYANIFLWIVLIIGGAILLVFTIFRLRERKYEIGVLAAIGMNKIKIATQFMIELFIVTFVAITIAIIIGGISSVPITNTLLANSSSTSAISEQMPSGEPSGMQEIPSEQSKQTAPSDSRNETFFNRSANYINEVSSATNFVVILQLLGITLALSILSGGMSVLFILRYEPLRILSDRE